MEGIQPIVVIIASTNRGWHRPVHTNRRAGGGGARSGGDGLRTEQVHTCALLPFSKSQLKLGRKTSLSKHNAISILIGVELKKRKL